MSCWSLFKSLASLDELPSQSPVLQYTHFLNIMKPLYKMSIPWAVILTAAMELKFFPFHYTHCPQKYFYLTNYVSSQLGKHGCQIVITLGEVSGPLVLSDMQFLALTQSQATGATLKGGSTVEHTGFLTQDRDRVVTGPWPNEKMLKCWGPAYSCWLLVRPKPQLLLLVGAQ